MVHVSNLVTLAASALWFTTSVNAAPTEGELAEMLIKRAILGYEDCTDDQKKKAGRAFADAATLARWTYDKKLEDGTEYKNTDAYKHYFTSDDGDKVAKMFSIVQQNNDPTNPPVQFKVTCKETDRCKQSLAITDSNPRTEKFTPLMRLCPKFFDPNTRETKNDLDSKESEPKPGRRDNSWCQPGQRFRDFETAGLTVLHEMTHLDEVGKKVGLSERPADRDEPDGEKSHGTEDVYELEDPNWKNYDTQSPARSARRLKENWEKAAKGKEPILKRVENAESYAASATEFYFMQKCKFDTIEAMMLIQDDLLTGPGA